uniref:Breast cancer type 2 susceptibility protein n=1 Tax=Oryzias sinensis TaxID=183150 RepID=A0A8C7WVW6_9TELE
MYNIFKHDVWKALVFELGPLDPNWFEVLTAEASVIEGSLSDQDELCANQEGNSKDTLEKPAVESQLFSTPKVFRHSRMVSPQTEDEQSFTLPQGKGALPWTKTQSPLLFQLTTQGVSGEKCEVFQPQSDDSFDLLSTPNKSTTSYAKHISESLGAQINPDISWTSSLNTPPAVPSTLILSKADNKPCTGNAPTDGNVVFVRKLFPSLSKSSASKASKNNDPLAFQGPHSPKFDPETFSNQEERVWQQKLPDAIEDGDVRSAVADVLDGAEDALSIFFANSSSALRKVKPERTKRKQILQAKENAYSSKDDLTGSKATSDEEGNGHLEPGGCTSSPLLKMGHAATSQWSPLSLSEIPLCSVGGNVVQEQLQGEAHSSQFSGPSKEILNAEFQSKTRFVDRVGIPEPQSMKINSSVEIPYSEGLCVGQVESAPNNTDCCNAGKTEGLEQNQPVEVNVVGTVKTNMSQLCRDFAQDFSQIPESGGVPKDSRDHFSPSACLSAMKKAKQKAGEGNPHHQCNSISNSVFPITDVPVNDSGFHSAVVNGTILTASSFSENIGLSRTCTELKSEFHTETVFPSTKAFPETGPSGPKADIELISAETSKEKEVDPGRANKSPTDVTIQQPSRTGDIHSVPINDPKHDGQTKKTSTSLPAAHSLGFKTASNKGIHISSASLKRARQIFKETESETAFYDQPSTSDWDTTKRSTNDKTGNISTFSLKPTQTSITETFGNITPQLTASQTDDVTELCSLLEQTDSQFEVTPFKTLKAKQQDDGKSPQKADKELDPDFLAGIDFDDSFSSDLLQCARNENISPSLKDNSQDEASVVSDDPQRAVQASKRQSKVSGVAFKTAGGKVLRVSDKCLSKAKALFADLDGFTTNRESSSNKSIEIGFNTKQKCAMDPSICTKNPTYTVEEDVHAERVGNCFKNHIVLASENEKPQTPKQHVSGCSVTGNAKLLPCRTKEPHLEMVKVDSNQLKALKNSAPFHRNSFSASKSDPSPLCVTSKTIDSNENCPAAGFCTAGGKKGFVSTDKMENSEYLLEEIHTPENGKGQLEENKS